MTSNLPVALITGGTRGIGKAIADQLAHTHRLLIGGRNEQAAAAVAGAFPDARPWVCDLANPEATITAAASVERLDVLIHSAGVFPSEPMPLRESWRHVMEVNVIAVAHLTDLLLPLLRQSQGLVVMINSGSGLNARADVSGYAASKFALTGYADGLREAEQGRVRVASIHPGRVDTDMQRQLQVKLGRPYDASEHMPVEAVAAAVRLAVETPPSTVIQSLTIRPV